MRLKRVHVTAEVLERVIDSAQMRAMPCRL